MRKRDCIISIKLVLGWEILNIGSVYAPQAQLAKDIKKLFWVKLDEIIQSIPQTEKLVNGAYFIMI